MANKYLRLAAEGLANKAKRLKASLTGHTKLCVLSDSHGQVFEYMSEHRMPPNAHWDLGIVQGATAHGMGNPHSKTQAFEQFKQKVLNRPWRYDAIIIQLGEVDCGFVIWHRAEKYNETVQAQMENSLANYTRFVDWLREQNAADTIILTGAIVPTIRDDRSEEQMGQVANLRNSIQATQHERTQLTHDFNAALAAYAAKNSLHYADITASILGEDGLVASAYLHEDPMDHHLSSAKTAPLWLDALAPHLTNSR